MEVLFFTNEDGNSETGTSSYSGWTLRWSAVTPGECQLFLDGRSDDSLKRNG